MLQQLLLSSTCVNADSDILLVDIAFTSTPESVLSRLLKVLDTRLDAAHQWAECLAHDLARQS